MDTHTSASSPASHERTSDQAAPAKQTAAGEFSPGTPVIYAMHGKCTVLGIESRKMGEEQIRFYKLEVQKSALSRSTRLEPAIWVPVSSARERGLRAPITASDVDIIMKVIQSREYYFQANESWSSIQPKLEASIRIEGAIGLAKALSYLYVLKRKQIVPAPEVVRMMETISKLLLRELSEILGEPIRTIEDRIARGLKQKLIPDT